MSTILLDCDGLLSNFVSALGYVEEPDTWEFMTHDDRNLACSEGFALNMAAYSDSYSGVSTLHAYGHTLVVVTSHYRDSRGWVRDRDDWLKAHYGLTDVVHTHSKHLICGDIFVDDNEDNVRKWKAAHPDKTAVLWARKWNEKSTYLPRFNDWQTLATLASIIDDVTP